LYHPCWGPFDLAVGSRIISVFSGPAARRIYKQRDDFEPSKVPKKIVTKRQRETFKLYKKVAGLKKLSLSQLEKLLEELRRQNNSWLLFLELLEFVKNKKDLKKQILERLGPVEKTTVQNKKAFLLGKQFYKIK